MIVPSLCLDNGNVTGDSAEKLLAAAKQKSKELGVAMNIAIVDTGANLVAFTRWANTDISHYYLKELKMTLYHIASLTLLTIHPNDFSIALL